MNLLIDYDFDITYHTDKAIVVADSLSGKEPRSEYRLKAINLVIVYNVFDHIRVAQLETLKKEHWKVCVILKL